MKKRLISVFILAVITVIAFLFYSKKTVDTEIFIKAKYGEFKSSVTNTGEIRAKKSIDVRAPDNARAIGIYNMKITKLVPEGTIVKAGDFVAELDRSEVMNKVREAQLQVQKYEAQFTQAKLDSTLTLSSARDELENIKYMLEEKKLQLDQSKFEAPAIIRQVELDFEKTKRSYEQSKINYQTKVKQAIAKLEVNSTDLMKEVQKLTQLTDVTAKFTIIAPDSGIVIYDRDWGGRKKIVGSTVDAWNPVVATLPDLSQMESVTFVNEVDIQKIKVGQFVQIGLDANPNKKLIGKVTNVANIGEEMKSSNAKVFEVLISIVDKDSTLLPSMTTSNQILVSTIANAVSIPIECVHTEEKDGKKNHFIFKKSKGKKVKQSVELGLMNENEVVILSGVNKDDEIMLSAVEEKKNDDAQKKTSK